jgi:8-amino-7-oxononanoate synthase
MRVMSSLDEFAQEKRAALEARLELRHLEATARQAGAHVMRNGRQLVSFSCNDYLGLSSHPAVIEAAAKALRDYGTGAGGSRLVTGNNPLYAVLEEKLARFKQTEDAMVFGSGYLANLGIVPALAGRGDLVLIDALAHACLMSGTRLSGAEEIRFPHNDTAFVARTLGARRAAFRHVLILTEGVFSMDGDLAPLPELAAIAARYDAWLLTDDAHGTGVVGGGRGAAFAFGPEKVSVPLQMGTLSKAIGGYGGYLCASAAVVDLLRSRARSFVYATGLPPASLAGAIAALDIIESEPGLVARPLTLAQAFTRALNLPLAQSAIVPVIIGDSGKALQAMAVLEEAGFLVTAIRPPTVPAGTARLRFAFSAAHRAEEVDGLAALVRERILPDFGR